MTDTDNAVLPLLRMKIALSTGALLLAALGLGCSDKSEPLLRPRGLAPGEEVPRGPVAAPLPAPPPPPPPPPSRLGSPFAPKAPDPGALRRTGLAIEDAGSAPTTPSSPSTTAADTGVQRDLPAELTALLGQPAECLDLAQVASAGGRVTIIVTAYAVPSGRITRASATAPGQPATALRCIEQRAASISLRGPVPGAPLQVTATIPVEVISQPSPR